MFTVSIDFCDDLGQHLLSRVDTQHGQDRRNHGGTNAAFLLDIECVEGLLQHYNRPSDSKKNAKIYKDLRAI
jgi:hypothetical protein